jgi:hypothetical protein
VKHVLTTALALIVLGIAAVSAQAATNPSGTGQPSQTCVDTVTAAMEPGRAASAPGSAFNEDGGIAGSVYAGNGATTKTPANAAAVSQYDVACYQVTQQSH